MDVQRNNATEILLERDTEVSRLSSDLHDEMAEYIEFLKEMQWARDEMKIFADAAPKKF